MIQFEIANTASMDKIMKMGKSQSFNPDEMLECLLGKDYEWRIGDMDKVLKGNFGDA